MNDLLTKLDNLKRPRLLIQAARIGMAEYRRDVHLRRHLGQGPLPRSGAALARLVEIETDINEQRRMRNTGYSSIKHVDLLIAMMGEARILRTSSIEFAPLRKCVR
ncbi:DUF6477 family protein [Roseovarius aestuarii]|uniref:Uncharacterized protein n=1 Tax=Roseovarius aestuarii TaxID=475083 RepID=A0A1X7BNM7_9RHOB|nr:DUF6477 family protein [Roseovarius aestuarii]SMC11191.1 hypothetical protein ROA7745_01002 [Roseovarius aestuarii]